MSCYNGKFHKLYYQPIVKNYAYHMMLLFLIGKNECKNIRREAFLEDNNSVMKKHDYAEIWRQILICKFSPRHVASTTLSQ